MSTSYLSQDDGPPPRTYAGARSLLTRTALGVEDWGLRFAGQKQWTIERAITDEVIDLTRRGRDPLLRELVIRAVLAGLPGVADELLRRFGPLHSLPSATYCADIIWVDTWGNERADVEAKSRRAAGNWVPLNSVLAQVEAETLVWRSDARARAFRAGVAEYLEQWENVSQAEYPCWWRQQWLNDGYRPVAGVPLILWTAALRRDAAATWRGADHADQWKTTRWLKSFSFLLGAISDPAVRGCLHPDDMVGLERLTRMIGSA